MNTPICDFVRRYREADSLRLHMPGHKGQGILGCEALDITEIDGADSLYEAGGIIRESERNASLLFGCDTYYSTEGSSQCIRAMLYLAALHAKTEGKRPRIAAARNVHKTFLSAAALLDLDIIWLYPRNLDSYLSCRLDAMDVEKALSEMEEKPTAVYLTSPDYLGNLARVQEIAGICRRHGVLLLVDNAHGAYLRFLPESLHPMDLGADLCCDSAHKTLPVLTGGAYLHISQDAPPLFSAQAKNALALFGSTSPSYLILQSLDAANAYLARGYRERLHSFICHVQWLKDRLADHGYRLRGEEPLKITIAPKSCGYEGSELAWLLREKNIICEFSDPDFLVLMLTPEIGEHGLARLEEELLSVPRGAPITTEPPRFHAAGAVMTVRSAVMAPSETVAAQDSLGRVAACTSVGCPPAVPIVSCGERIDAHALQAFRYYGITSCNVTCEHA